MGVIKEDYGQIPFPNCKVYYAHHRYKYGTKIEEYELNLIQSSTILNSKVFNPATDLKTKSKSERTIMKECIREVKNSDVVIFSSMDGVIGIGVYKEIMAAKKAHIPTFYIYQNRLWADWKIRINEDDSACDRLYAYVDIKR